MDPRLLLIFLSGFIGGTGAFFIGAPMPYMLGGIFGAACFAVSYTHLTLPTTVFV